MTGVQTCALPISYYLPTEDRYLHTKEELLDVMKVALAGRAAEELVFGRVTNGASNDLEKVTDIARRMVFEYGMSEVAAARTMRADNYALSEETKRVRDSEHRVYEMMSEALHGLVAGDAHIKRMAGSLGEDKVRGVDVESLRDPAVVDALAAWIGGDRASPTSAAPTEGFKFDTSAGDLEFKRRFLDYIGATG